MKKLLFIPFFLIISSCAGDDITYGDFNTPLVSENYLVLGTNPINYDKSKSLNTLIYYAGSPATNNYLLQNSYNISSGKEYANQVLKNNIVQSKQNVQKNVIEIINEENRVIQNYAFENNIKPILQDNNIIKRTIPKTIEKGTKWENVYIYHSGNNFRIINAVCIYVSKNAYFFLQDGLTIKDEQIEEIAAAFDKDYEIVHKYYGEETDTDGNGKVSFLITDLEDNLYGFFYSADKYPNNLIQNIKSNEADILYVNHDFFSGDKWERYKTDLKATFIHEFQHMVLFDCRSRLDLNTFIGTWINEGLSMLSEYYGGYGQAHKHYISNYFSKKQGISLITDDVSQDYGLSYLFIRYMQIRFGDIFIKKIYSSKYTGIEAVEYATSVNFNDLFLDFIKMILVTGRNITLDKKYNIDEFNYYEGSEGYAKNGFNLANTIDEVYSYNSSNNSFITSNGYSKDLQMYGFFVTKWKGNIETLELNGNNGIAGMYAAW